jgi:hypothetical protein
MLLDLYLFFVFSLVSSYLNIIFEQSVNKTADFRENGTG